LPWKDTYRHIALPLRDAGFSNQNGITENRPLSSVFYLPTSVFRLPTSDFRLLSSVFCLLTEIQRKYAFFPDFLPYQLGLSLYLIAPGLIEILGYLLKSLECMDENELGHTLIPRLPIRAQRRPMEKTQ